MKIGKYGRGNMAQAQADRIAATFWARRRDFAVSAEAYGIEEALDKTLAARESTVFLSDSGDNPGAGGTTDVPALLAARPARRATPRLQARATPSSRPWPRPACSNARPKVSG